ncbi:MAG TPA: hypothetical protein VE954_11870 [Oligoflexus sp.]|uniref:hypothetical protein n=1 Tax=Oligoflexus sp. TaxID=1971216 RepID=UPI002D3859E4|nr:hypothetical protein [Oligoflexus sp.]HYX33803.1 hypothetical protein [Oligoflexus sp.]
MIDLASVRRLALTQLPVYRQIYSADFTLLDSYRLAKILLAGEQEQKYRKPRNKKPTRTNTR